MASRAHARGQYVPADRAHKGTDGHGQLRVARGEDSGVRSGGNGRGATTWRVSGGFLLFLAECLGLAFVVVAAGRAIRGWQRVFLFSAFVCAI